MIKAERAHSTISGTASEIGAELCCLVANVLETIGEELPNSALVIYEELMKTASSSMDKIQRTQKGSKKKTKSSIEEFLDTLSDDEKEVLMKIIDKFDDEEDD